MCPCRVLSASYDRVTSRVFHGQGPRQSCPASTLTRHLVRTLQGVDTVRRHEGRVRSRAMRWSRACWLLVPALIGMLVGLALTWPSAILIVDGGPGCTSCGTYTTSMIGLRAHGGAVIQQAVGAGIGFLAGGLIAFGLIRPQRSWR